MDIKDEVRGRWPGLLSQLGISVGTGKHQFCPICSPGVEKSDRFRFDDKDGSGSYICGQCGAGDGWALVMKCLSIDFREAVRVIEGVIGKAPKTPINNGLQYKPEILRQMYRDSTPLTGNCLGSRYLKNRGLKTFPSTLRLLKQCYEPSTKTKMPAILATFSAPDSEAITIHRTFISQDGKKANVENPKMTMTPKRPMAGGAVRLFPAESEIGLAEGIETAIAVHELYNIPVWATLSASLMKSFEPPKSVKNIIIYCDADNNFCGQSAAYALANRLYLAHYAVSVETPDHGTDYLDMLNDGKSTTFDNRLDKHK